MTKSSYEFNLNLSKLDRQPKAKKTVTFFENFGEQEVDQLIISYTNEFEKFREQQKDINADQKIFVAEFERYSRSFKPYYNNNAYFRKGFYQLCYYFTEYFKILIENTNSSKEDDTYYRSLKDEFISGETENYKNPKLFGATVNIDVPKTNTSADILNQLDELVRKSGLAYAKVYTNFLTHKLNFPDKFDNCFTNISVNDFEKKFDESFIYFLLCILYKRFRSDKHKLLDIEINRLFRTTFFNFCEREYLHNKISEENKYVAHQIKLDNPRDMITDYENFKSKPEYHTLYTHYKKNFDNNIQTYRGPKDFHNQIPKYSNYDLKKVLNLRSPVIESILPSTELKLNQLVNYRNKARETYTYRSRSSECLQRGVAPQLYSHYNVETHNVQYIDRVKYSPEKTVNIDVSSSPYSQYKYKNYNALKKLNKITSKLVKTDNSSNEDYRNFDIKTYTANQMSSMLNDKEESQPQKQLLKESQSLSSLSNAQTRSYSLKNSLDKARIRSRYNILSKY